MLNNTRMGEEIGKTWKEDYLNKSFEKTKQEIITKTTREVIKKAKIKIPHKHKVLSSIVKDTVENIVQPLLPRQRLPRPSYIYFLNTLNKM